MSMSGLSFDNINFNVYKSVDGRTCSFWNDIIDLKIVDVVGYGQFEIYLNKDTDQKIVKKIVGQSLETELTQIPIYDLHINDDDYFTYGTQDESNLDSYGNIKPIKLYNPFDKNHSLLHLLLMDKACHWSLGVVPEYITVTNNGKQEKELATSFQRTFTIDGQNIYDFLVGDLANEANLVYVFDTYNRRINIYDRYSVGEDTNVFINTRNLASNISINDNSDSLKNCFRVAGGDDVITNYLSAINLTGNYIWGFGDLQYKDMPEGLVNAIKSYQTLKNTLNDEYYGGYDIFNQLLSEGKSVSTVLIFDGNVNTYSSLPSASGKTGHYYYVSNENKYYVSNGSSWVRCGAFTRLCSAYDYLSYLEDTMMPNVSLKTTSAQEQAGRIENDLKNTYVAVQNMSIYSSSSFTGITNNVTAYCKVIADNRYSIESVDDITNNYPRYNGNTWTGKLRIYRTVDKNDEKTIIVSAKINDDELNFAKQKILKAVAKNEMAEVDQDVLAYTTSADYGKLVLYFQKYSMKRLKSFYNGYESCLSILMSFHSSAKDTSAFKTIYTTYRLRRDAVYEVYKIREKEVEKQKQLIERFETEKSAIQIQADFKSYLDKTDSSYWKLFNSYRREDTYQNSNYVSDGLTDGQILAKCKELLDYANYQLSMACQLQRTCSITLSNLLIMDEFKPFWDKFQIYNYIRIENDNEILKLRLIQVDVDFNKIEQLNVTFAENISGNGNIASDIADIIQQAGSMASSYNSIKQQSSQGNKAFNEVGKWYADGLNAAKTTISNSDNNEVTYGSYGINLKDMTEEGNYGDWQTRLIGQGIYFTSDNWKTVYAALGSIYIDGERTTGLIAENLIGKLIAGQTLYITNESGSFLLSGDTAKFTDITIDYQDKNGNRVKIGGATDRIFSISHNGNEVLYFNNVSNKMVMTGTLQGCDGDFSGTLNACHMSASTITGSTISANNLNGNTISGGSITIGNNFSVDTNGNMKATNANFTGTIHAGTAIYSPSINSGSITGTSINIGNGNFVVDSYGNMTANKGTFRGDIISSNITTTSIKGGSIEGTDIKARSFSLWNGNLGRYDTIITATSLWHSDFGTIPIADIYGNSLYSYGGQSYLQTDNIITSSLKSSNSALYGTTECGTLKASRADIDTLVPHSIDWSYCSLKTTEVMPEYSYSNSGGNGAGAALIRFKNQSDNNSCAATAKYVQNYVQNYLSDKVDLQNYLFAVHENPYNGQPNAVIARISQSGHTLNYAKYSSWTSDKRLKTDVSDMPDITSVYMKLKPKKFRFNNLLSGYDRLWHYGLMAQDVEQELNRIGINTEDAGIIYKTDCDDSFHEKEIIGNSKVYKLDKNELHAFHIQMIQKIQKEVISMKENYDNAIFSLQGENAILKQQLLRLEELINAGN